MIDQESLTTNKKENNNKEEKNMSIQAAEVLRNQEDVQGEVIANKVNEGDLSEDQIRDKDDLELNQNDSGDNLSDESNNYLEHDDKSNQVAFETLDDLIQYYKEKYQSDSWKYLSWWKEISTKNKYKAGDLVYIAGEKKYGVFLEPARKEGLIRVANLKKNKPEIYTRPWYYELHEIQLVKRGDKIVKGFLQVQNSLYKIEV